MNLPPGNALLDALDWHLAIGADQALSDDPVNLLAAPTFAEISVPVAAPKPPQKVQATVAIQAPAALPLAPAALVQEAVARAAAAHTLAELRQAILAFDGVESKATATQIVFADGHESARVMVVGEAPGADEDRIGRPFVGVSGQLLDRMLAAIGLARTETDPGQAVYISNVLNWRPPGNRTPTPTEIEISRPFILRHIELVAPAVLLLAGGVAAKALLETGEGITKLRGRGLSVTLADGRVVPTIATYHPSYLLRTPSKKAEAWSDILRLKTHIKSL